MISLRDLTFGLILFKSIFPGHAAAAAIDSNRDAKVDEIARRSLETVVVTRSAGAVNIGLTTLTSATIATRSLVPIVATDLALTTLTSATIITRSLVPVVTVAAQPTAVVSVVTLGTASLSLASAAASAPPLVPMMNTPDTPTAQDYALKTNTTWYWTYDGERYNMKGNLRPRINVSQALMFLSLSSNVAYMMRQMVAFWVSRG